MQLFEEMEEAVGEVAVLVAVRRAPLYPRLDLT